MRNRKLGESAPQQPNSPENWILARRNFVIAGTAGVSFLAWLALKKKEKGEKVEQTEADHFLEKFPDSLPGVSLGGVKKHPVTGAQHCLVHLRDVHSTSYILINKFDALAEVKQLPLHVSMASSHLFSGGSYEDLNWELNPKEKQQIEAILQTHQVQQWMKDCSEVDEAEGSEQNQSVALAMKNISQELGLREMIIEGMSSEDQEMTDMHYAIIDRQKLQISQLMQMTTTDPSLREELRDAQVGLFVLEKFYRNNLGILAPLHQQGIIRPVASHNETLDREISAILQQVESGSVDEEQLRLTNEKREKAVLEIGTTGSAVASRYGGDHDFWKRIQQWNQENPEHRYSLIELTPDGYEAERNRPNREH